MTNKEIILLDHSEKLLFALTLCLNKLVQETQNVKENITVFHLKNPPSVSLSSYLTRIFKFMNCSPIVYVTALILLDRAQEQNENFYVTARNVHRLIISSVTISAKYLEDFYYKNSYYANVGGITAKVLNELEHEFLELIQFDCSVSEQTVRMYLQRLDTFSEMNSIEQK